MVDTFVRWWVLGRKAHLQHPGKGHPIHDSEAATWCGQSIPRGVSQAVYEPQCAECLKALRKYQTEALVSLPDLVVEEVVIRVTRPQDSTSNAADVCEAALRRKRSWADVNVRSQVIGGVDECACGPTSTCVMHGGVAE